MILLAGNFLNTGKMFGNAAGFKISSLRTADPTRSKLHLSSNKGASFTLLHYLVDQAKEAKVGILFKPKDLALMREASKTSKEALVEEEIRPIEDKMADILGQMEKANDMSTTIRSGRLLCGSKYKTRLKII